MGFSKHRTPMVSGMSFRRCLSGGGDIFSKSVERQGGANRTFATGGRCHGWQLEPCPCGLEPLLTFRQKIPTGRPTPRKDVPFATGVRPVYGNPTLRAMHSIHKCVAKDTPHLFHWRLSPYKVKNKNSDLWASSQIAVSVLTLHGS